MVLMKIKRLTIIVFFDCPNRMSELYNMRVSNYLLLIALLTLGLQSCRSEYEERLEEAREIRDRLTLVENRYYMAPSIELREEIQSLEKEIQTLAKVSGDEEQFLAEIKL